MIKNIFLLITIVILNLTSNMLAQPYLFNLYEDPDNNDSTVFIIKINLTNNTTEQFLEVNNNFINNYHLSTNNWIVVVYRLCDGTTIYNINDPSNNISVEAPNSCFGGAILYAQNTNKIYYFERIDSNAIEIISLDLSIKTSDSIFTIPVSFNGEIGNREAFFSSTEDKLFFSIADTTYPPSVCDQDFVCSLSLINNQIVQQNRLSIYGYSNADGYNLYKGRGGKAIVGSFFWNEYKDIYFRLFDFDQNLGSNFIHYQGYTTPYFTGNGEYLILPQTVDSSGFDYNTGTIYIFSINSTNLIKTIILPSGGGIHQFDNYPNNIYYVKDLELPTRQIYTLKMDSIFNVLDLTSLSPSSKIVNAAPFTLTVNGYGFDTLSTVYFNGGTKTTTYVNDSVLTASISTSDISVIGNYPVWVTDEWGTSDTLMFAVTPQPADLTGLSPAIALTYDPLFWLEYFPVTVYGNNFNTSSVVYFAGNARTTTFISSTTLMFQARSYDVGVNAHTVPLWVSNSGAISDTLVFVVQTELANGISPEFYCVKDNGDDTFTARIGYNNPNTEAIYIPIGTKNRLVPGWPGLPQTFYPGEHLDDFTIDFDGGETVWELTRLEGSFSKKSDQCE